jgi:propanol-preferring alcohol dehydrogenase
LAAEIPILPAIPKYALEDANRAPVELRNRKIRGAKVLKIENCRFMEFYLILVP